MAAYSTEKKEPQLPPPSYDDVDAPQAGSGLSPSSSAPTAVDAISGPYLPTIIFAIPFPAPQRPKKRSPHPVSPYFLYTLPRAPYVKPAKDAWGKNVTHEGLVKKVERKWQEEIAEGDRIRNGLEPTAGRWKRFKGKAVGVANGVIHAMPNSRIEALGRVPPKKKIGQVYVLYPSDGSTPEGAPITPDFIQSNISTVLQKTKKRATINAVGSAMTLPITAAIDFFVVVPIFLFEMNLAYFSTQVSGRRKVTAITNSSHSSVRCTPASDLDAMSTVLRATCHHLSARHFDPLPGSRPGAPVSQDDLLAAADTIIYAFRSHAIDEVAARHILDRDEIAKDLKRCTKKAAKEYIQKV